MTATQPDGPERADLPDQSDAAPRVARPVDPERGLRGAMSATLVLEALTILLALPVAARTGGGVGPFGVGYILLLAAAHVAGCVVVKRYWALTAFLALQVLVVAGWFVSASLGVMGVVFGLVWLAIAWFRFEYRRRSAAGTLPSQQPPAG